MCSWPLVIFYCCCCCCRYIMSVPLLVHSEPKTFNSLQKLLREASLFTELSFFHHQFQQRPPYLPKKENPLHPHPHSLHSHHHWNLKKKKRFFSRNSQQWCWFMAVVLRIGMNPFRITSFSTLRHNPNGRNLTVVILLSISKPFMKWLNIWLPNTT